MVHLPKDLLSHPTRGAWIEIFVRWKFGLNNEESHPTRGAWIEMGIMPRSTRRLIRSHPTRGAWIEIDVKIAAAYIRVVAPHTGCVD